jgi:hypothetical protein
VGSMLAREHVTFLHATPWMLDLLVRNRQFVHVANSVELPVGTALTLALLPAIQLLSALKLHAKSWSPSLVHVGGYQPK